ncbi:MAG: enoyl-CoA hydratase-related protein [Allobranchiibius sp.]
MELVKYAVADAVATITLDSPHNRNALSRQLVGELIEALQSAQDDAQVRVVVLAADGPAFCAGADLKEAGAGSGGVGGLIEVQRLILTLAVPVVLRLHAPVRAGGLGLVGAADIVVAARSVTFAFTEARLALAPAIISLTTLPRMTSRAAAYTFLSGASFDADAAQAYGLVTSTVDDGWLDIEVARVVGELSTADPQGLRETKKLLNADMVAGIDDCGDEMAALSAELFGSESAQAAMKRFLESRARRT